MNDTPEPSPDHQSVVTISCDNCDVSYHIKWDVLENKDVEPTTCPFCGAESAVADDEAYFDNDEDEDNWN